MTRRVFPVAFVMIVVAGLALAMVVFRLGDQGPPLIPADPPQVLDQLSPSPSLPVGPEFRACTERFPFTSDVDGDGREDLVFIEFRQPFGPAFIGVCTAAGETDRLSGSGMGELLLVGDIESDGRQEIFFGGTTVSAQIANVVVFFNGKLRYVVLEDGELLTVVSGLWVDAEGATSGHTWGCRDTDDDGSNEIVRVIVTPEGETLRWSREAYRLEGSTATLVSKDSGSVREQKERAAEVASTLTLPCDLLSG